MHDVIRDVAISIAKHEKRYLVQHYLKKWPERFIYEHYSAISLMSEYFREIPSELGCKELHTLVLRSKDSSLPNSFFEGMETNLEVLDLSGMAIESLPKSLSKLVKLRMLLLPKGVSNMSLLGELKSLEILCFNCIEELKPEIKELTCLKLLDLGYNKNQKPTLIPPNVLANLTSMEELCNPDRFDGWQDEATNKEGASLVELNSLTSLTTLKVHIPQGKLSPNNHCFENLVRFRISVGECFDDYEQQSSGSMLKVSSVPLEEKFRILLVKSEVLYLREMKGLEEVLHYKGGSEFFNLKYLKVSECDGDEHLLGRPHQSMSRSFSNLSTLNVENCTFKYLFNLSVARHLEQLQKLNVEDCSNMEVIVGNEREGEDEQITFPRLKKIKLSGLPNLKSFCTSRRPSSITGESNSNASQSLFCEKVMVPALEKLSIQGLDNISKIMKEGRGSFNQLWSLNVENCTFKYLFNLSDARRLEQLQELNVEDCSNMEVIVGNEREGDNEEISFPRLKEIILGGLPNLKSFCTSRRPSSITGESNSNPSQTLFCEKVMVPALEKLSILGLDNISEIWDKQFQPIMKEGRGSFSQLWSLNVENCTFKYLFNLSDARRLEQLQELNVKHCSNMEVIVGNEREGDNEEITFPRLKEIILGGLPNLKSFCTSRRPSSITGESNSNPSQTLFCEKVMVPALEKLFIWGLDNISEIWDKQFQPIMKEERGSFNQLWYLYVDQCSRLVSVVPSHMVQRLRNLKTLEVGSCDSVVHEIEDLTSVFPRLETLTLGRLPKLRETGFNKKEDSLRGTNVVYPSIRAISIISCPNLKSIFSASIARNLAHLQSLEIRNDFDSYSKVKVIVETSKERDGASDEPFVFPELSFMDLEDMARIRSFCNSYGSEESFFNQKVVFPRLQYLTIWSLGNVKGIWDRTPPTGSFQNLTFLWLCECHNFLYVAPSELLGTLQNLEKLVIMSCELLEEVFINRGSDSGEGIVSKHGPPSEEADTNVVLHRLIRISLVDLPRLKSFCSGSKLPSSVIRDISGCPLLETDF